MIKTQEIIDYLKKNKDFFKKKLNIQKIGIFGSFATNSQNIKSDIDVLVSFKKNTSEIFEKKQILREMIRNKFNLKVDIATEEYLKPYIKKDIIKETINV